MPGRNIKLAPRAVTLLKNASTLGYSKYQALPGDFVVYKEYYQDKSHSLRMARVIGRIVECDRDGDSGVGKLCVLAISDDGSFGYERWVDPDDVVECKSPKHAQAFLSWLLTANTDAMFAYVRDDLETRRSAHPPGNV